MRKSISPTAGRYVVAMVIGLLLLVASSENDPVIPIDDALKRGLRGSYGEYLHALNNAAQRDTISIENVLRTDGLYDVAGYEHGWVLLELLQRIGDTRFHAALVKIDTLALKRACEYIEAGLDVHTRSFELRRQYPLTFQIVKNYGVLGALFVPSERHAGHYSAASEGSVSVWIDKDYRDCLQTSLPCAWADDASAILIVIDTADHMETIIDASEYASYRVHSSVKGLVHYLKRDEDTAGDIEQWYRGDTRNSRNESGTQVFIRISMPSGDNMNRLLLEYVNASYLRAMLLNRGFSPDAISDMQVVGLRCNNDLGTKNQLIMSNPTECPRIIEDQGNVLVVYQIVGNCDVKSIPSRIRWREILRVTK